MFIISVATATLQNVAKGAEGKAQRFVNLGAWILVVILMLWISFFDEEAKSRFRLHSMYRALRRLLCMHRKLWS